MTTHENHPAWWQVYLLALAIAGLLVWGAFSNLSERGHEAAAVGTVVLAWILVEAWLRANRRALLHVEGLHLVEQPAPDGAQAAGSGEAEAVRLGGEPVHGALPQEIVLPAAAPARSEGVVR